MAHNTRKISLHDALVLIYHIHQGADDTGIGFVDADNTRTSLTTALDRASWVALSDLESALWSCNLMNEKGKFWHPKGYTFDQFSRQVLKGRERFNKKYNWVE